MDNQCNKLGERLRELRAELGDTVRGFAVRIGKTPGYVSQIEVRGEIPAPDLLCRIADIHEINPEELLQLAKGDQVARTSKAIDKKHESAIKLKKKKKP